MPSIYDLKPGFQNLLRPTSNWLARHAVTPNQITICAVIISFLSGLLLAIYPRSCFALVLIPIVLFIRMILNAIDGMLAREHHMQSALGIFLNELGDVFSDIFLYLPFALIPGVNAYAIVCIVILAIISEMTGVIATQVGAKRRYDGPMGKSDRAFVFGAMGLLLGLGYEFFYWYTIIFIIAAFLLVVTIVKRIYKALREINYAAKS